MRIAAPLSSFLKVVLLSVILVLCLCGPWEFHKYNKLRLNDVQGSYFLRMTVTWFELALRNGPQPGNCLKFGQPVLGFTWIVVRKYARQREGSRKLTLVIFTCCQCASVINDFLTLNLVN
jgi:hypothetical protein